MKAQFAASKCSFILAALPCSLILMSVTFFYEEGTLPTGQCKKSQVGFFHVAHWPHHSSKPSGCNHRKQEELQVRKEANYLSA